MRSSSFFIATQKEVPAEAEIASHRLMLRAGLVRRLSAGIYSWLPLGVRVLQKVERIVREEMNRAGAMEIVMPVVQPAELWQESGRWQAYGPELLRLEDRHEREFVLQPTSEEVVTDLARSELKSYRRLPAHFYQIQTKFRDERRPRFGIMRGREFVMKDGYSFHADYADLEREYRNMYDTYTRIFTRLGLRFRAVAADTGAIGGTGSHEFHVLAESGEDAIAFCPQSDYAANVELAEALAPAPPRAPAREELRKVATPGKTKCEDVAALLGIALERTVKAVALVRTSVPYGVPGAFTLLLLRGDHELNEVKAQKVIGPFRFASEAEVEDALGCRAGYIGPVDIAESIAVYADRTVAHLSDFVCGANEPGYHLAGVNFGRDLPEPHVADLRNVVPGDPSPDGRGRLEIVRGIEVGHIFQLRTKYSTSMHATFLDASGAEKPFEMGCYGIGVTRVVAAAIEQNHDARGIVFPAPIAPFEACIVPIGYHKSAAVRQAADDLYQELRGSGVDVLLEDREERPGVLFADMDLIGIPQRVVLSERGLAAGTAELKGRRDEKPQDVPLARLAPLLGQKAA
ncbi:MAG TPA: proline--tRNA ligase [Burkholderiales bacterium]|nr:proline--tRNA ligase [Burkholderiales bacterium]